MKCAIVIFLFIFYDIKSTTGTQTGKPVKNQAPIEFNSIGVNLYEDVRFFLYTRKNSKDGQQLWVNNKEVLSKSVYNNSLPTKFIVHGWHSNRTSEICVTVRDAFLFHDNYNVIVVDWGNFAKNEYPDAASRVKVVGGYVAKMVIFLRKQGSDINHLSLVGHSLGAHIVGLAGYQMDEKVPHIVGLDPGKPGFELFGAEGRIDSTDADQVEIIHTCKDNLGLSKRLGHVDFYSNGGGPTQPGCGSDSNGLCAHRRAFYFYAEGLKRPDDWLAIRCNSYENFTLGNCKNNTVVQFPRWQADKSRPNGIYFLRTKATEPYGLGKKGVVPPSSDELADTSLRLS